MIVYRITKKNLDNNDFQFVRKIKYEDDYIIITSVLPRLEKEEKKKVIVTVPANEKNWMVFKQKFFNNEKTSNI